MPGAEPAVGLCVAHTMAPCADATGFWCGDVPDLWEHSADKAEVGVAHRGGCRVLLRHWRQKKQGSDLGLGQGLGGPTIASRLGPSPIPVLRPQKPLHMPGGDGHRGKSLKLLEKIPEDAEATVVLVGEKGWVLEAGRVNVLCYGLCPSLLWSVPLDFWRRLL